MTEADYLLRSSAIFDAVGLDTFEGFVAVAGRKILAIGRGSGREKAKGVTMVTPSKKGAIFWIILFLFLKR